MIVRSADPLQGESIRVAVNRIRCCPEAVPEGESWPARKPARKSPGESGRHQRRQRHHRVQNPSKNLQCMERSSLWNSIVRRGRPTQWEQEVNFQLFSVCTFNSDCECKDF